MTLRKKTLLIFGLTLMGVIVISYVTTSVILLQRFARLEEQDARQNVQRILEVVSDRLVTLNSKAGDWANWDDAYAFIEDANADFIKTNITSQTFIELNINLMLFVRSSGELVFSRAFELEDEAAIPVPESLKAQLSQSDTLWRHHTAESRLMGLILLPEGPLLFASRPILTSEGRGPVRGALIMGQFFDSDAIAYMARETHLSFSISRVDDQQMPHDFWDARASLMTMGEKAVLVHPLNTHTVSGYTLLKDIYGKPALIVRVDLPRAIFKQGRITVHYLLFSLLGIGLIFGLLTLVLLEKSVLSRLIYLSGEVSGISRSGDLARRVLVIGKDELSSLAGAINGLLQALARSQQELHKMYNELELRVRERTEDLLKANEALQAEVKERHRVEAALRNSEKNYRELFLNAPVGIFQTSIEGRPLNVNPALAAMFGYESPQEVIDNIDNLAQQVYVHPAQRQEMIDKALQGDDRFQWEGEYCRRDGRLLIAQVYGRLVRRDDGTVLCLEGFAEDITNRKMLEKRLLQTQEELEHQVQERTRELNAKAQSLEEANAALKVLLQQREEDRLEGEEAILSNVKTLILPYLDRLKRSRLDGDQLSCLSFMEAHLQEITSPFIRKLSQPFLGLTPAEIQVAEMIREGKGSKEIAEFLCLSESTILFHRYNIRCKLGLKGKKLNLRSYLQSLS